MTNSRIIIERFTYLVLPLVFGAILFPMLFARFPGLGILESAGSEKNKSTDHLSTRGWATKRTPSPSILGGNKTEGVIQWRCCIDPLVVNSRRDHPPASEVQMKNLSCPNNPSNFSYYYPVATENLNSTKWHRAKIVFVGGSTTRQMHEQLVWEMPEMRGRTSFAFQQFLFKKNGHGHGCCEHNRTHDLDLRAIAPQLVEGLKEADFVIFNVGNWWQTKTIGHVIDDSGRHWAVDGGPSEWNILNESSSAVTDRVDSGMPRQALKPPSVRFADLMDRAIRLMLAAASPGTKLVYRSETFTDCPPGTNFRGSIAPVLKRQGVPVLNISESVCAYQRSHPSHLGPHLCFPSVALRHWLQKFQEQFLN